MTSEFTVALQQNNVETLTQLLEDVSNPESENYGDYYSSESIRSSFGIGFNYYSPVGPISLSWGFPIADEEYDIKRMFLFTIGGIN